MVGGAAEFQAVGDLMGALGEVLGGCRLARAPETITLGEIVRRLEGRRAAAGEAFLKELDRTTLADCAYPGALGGRPATW